MAVFPFRLSVLDMMPSISLLTGRPVNIPIFSLPKEASRDEDSGQVQATWDPSQSSCIASSSTLEDAGERNNVGWSSVDGMGWNGTGTLDKKARILL
jgi:hypothetical protein